MGEIIIKVPENVREVIDLGIPYKKVMEKIEEIEKEEVEDFLNFLLENAGKLKEEDLPKEEEIYLQGD